MGQDGGAWASDPATAFATAFVPQGIGADLIATIEGFSREDVDTFAVESNHRAAKAWADGRFARSVVPVVDLNGVTVLDRDEFIKPESSVEGMAKLKPSFAGIGDQAGIRGEASIGAAVLQRLLRRTQVADAVVEHRHQGPRRG